MNRLPKLVRQLSFISALLLAITISFLGGCRPILGPRVRALTARKFDATPARLARGRYLAENVAGCMDCHSPHDWTQHDAPIPPGKLATGALIAITGVPAKVYAPNLTPDPETGTGNWTDDQLARAIREGIGHDGRTLFPMMPYRHFKSMSEEDLASVIVFIRSLPPVRNSLPKTRVTFPANLWIRSMPEPVRQAVPQPDPSTPAARGAYLLNIAGCSDCHTPQRRGKPIRGMDFAGGFVLAGPWGRVASANLTQDPTGITYYDDQLFLQVMRTGYAGAREISQIMPWSSYRGMTDHDLRDLFAYVKTIPPVRHRVDNSESPTLCPLDGERHGAGSSNHK